MENRKLGDSKNKTADNEQQQPAMDADSNIGKYIC